jgi:hypothetical protein
LAPLAFSSVHNFDPRAKRRVERTGPIAYPLFSSTRRRRIADASAQVTAQSCSAPMTERVRCKGCARKRISGTRRVVAMQAWPTTPVAERAALYL